MDKRKIFEPGKKLLFPGMECRIDSFLGKGSNALVYIGSYPDDQLPKLRHRVLIKELFPFDEQGRIYRDMEGNVCRREEAEPIWELHRFSFQRGNQVHLALLETYPQEIDANINTFSLYQTLYSVLGFSGGRSLAKELETGRPSGIPLAVHIRRILGLLNVLEAFHGSGYLHLDISPENVLLIGDGRKERISLIDYNSVHTLGEIQEGTSVYYSGKEGFTAPEIRLGQIGSIGYPSDLYGVTAVFYQLLTGKKLSVLQTVRGQVPDISKAPCLAHMPDTVFSMVKKILRRGFSAVVSRRYQNVTEMRQDLEELQDRSEGKGITHAALWETGRRNILRAVSANPALKYIKEDENIYPIIGETYEGETVILQDMVEKIIFYQGSSALLLGGGGAGKTTALMRQAYIQPGTYSGINPAFTYLSLYGWSQGNPSYIKDMILESLKFKPHTESIEMARHELLRILSTPIQCKWGERPRLVILLDGWNEVSGDTGELLQEILDLSKLKGIRILLTSRSDIEEISFDKYFLRPLEKGEVKKILGKNGILMPEQEEILELLRSPMMLSIYMKAVLHEEKQISIHSKEQLLDSYFAAILRKEIRKLPEESGERWQVEAALSYVLPELAKHMNRRGCALSDEAMLPVLEKCYRRIKDKHMAKVFPEWIGHFSHITEGTASAEEWYGRMVQGLLWRRMGMIVRDEWGRYRISHQLLEEYLVEMQKDFGRKFIRHERRKRFFYLVLCAACGGSIYHWVYRPYLLGTQGEVKEPYDGAVSEQVLDAAFTSYIICGKQYETFLDLINCFADENCSETQWELLVSNCRRELKRDTTMGVSLAESYLGKLYASGEVMPWSKHPLEEDTYLEMISLPKEREEEYERCLNVLIRGREDKNTWDVLNGDEYLENLQDFLEADARVLGEYYNLIVGPELKGMENSDLEDERKNYKLYMAARAFVSEQNKITKEGDKAAESIEDYKREQKDALLVLRKNTLSQYFGTEKGK